MVPKPIVRQLPKHITHLVLVFWILKATGIEVGLLVNFGTKPEVKRKAFDFLRKSA